MRNRVQWLPLLLLAAGCESLLGVDFDQAKVAAGSGGISGASGQSGAGGKGAQGGAPSAGQGGASGAGQGGAGAQGGMGAQGGAGAEGGVGAMAGTSGQAGVSGGGNAGQTMGGSAGEAGSSGGVGGAGQGGVGAMSGTSGQGGMTTGGSGGLGGAAGESAGGGAGMSGAGQGGGGSAGECSGMTCQVPLKCSGGLVDGQCGCTPSETLCMEGKLYQCSATGSFAFLLKECKDNSCADASACIDGCKPGTELCEGNKRLICDSPDTLTDCEGQQFCNVRNGKATCDNCIAGGLTCATKNKDGLIVHELYACTANFSQFDLKRQCPSDLDCKQATYTGTCPSVCLPKQNYCDQKIPDLLHSCNGDGSEDTTTDCTKVQSGYKCVEGACVPP